MFSYIGPFKRVWRSSMFHLAAYHATVTCLFLETLHLLKIYNTSFPPALLPTINKVKVSRDKEISCWCIIFLRVYSGWCWASGGYISYGHVDDINHYWNASRLSIICTDISPSPPPTTTKMISVQKFYHYAFFIDEQTPIMLHRYQAACLQKC